MPLNLAAITSDDISKAALMDDEDAAALYLQNLAGIEDGGICALALSGIMWSTSDAGQRAEALGFWLSIERSYANA